MSDPLAPLRAAIGADRIDTGEAARALAGQDIFTEGPPVAAVVRPADTRHVQAIVAFARASGHILAPRGGGMSYTRGYLTSDPARTLTLDMRDMAAIRAVDAGGMYAVAEPGCSWAALDAQLAPLGLETPFRGPVSGRLATIGGAVAQNAVFYGSGRFGTAADSVIGMEVVTGTAEVIRTGSLGVAGATPFLRHFGPDLTGLFTADCGALGIKTAIVLRLRRRPPVREATSFIAQDSEALFAFFDAVALDGRASQTMALDVRLQGERLRQTGRRAQIAYVRALLGGTGSPLRRVREAAGVARARLSSPTGRGFAAHIFLEGEDAAECAAQAQALGRTAQKLGLAPAGAAVAQAMLRTPFGPVTGLAGGPGERWAPVHFILPRPGAREGMAAINALVAEEQAALTAHGIKVRHLIATLGAGAVTLEPMFLWRDRLTPLAHATLIAEGGSASADAPARPEALAEVARLRAAMIARLDAIGALHTQLGRTYPFTARLGPATAALFAGIRAQLDPDGVMNPGVLG